MALFLKHERRSGTWTKDLCIGIRLGGRNDDYGVTRRIGNKDVISKLKASFLRKQESNNTRIATRFRGAGPSR